MWYVYISLFNKISIFYIRRGKTTNFLEYGFSDIHSRSYKLKIKRFQQTVLMGVAVYQSNGSATKPSFMGF